MDETLITTNVASPFEPLLTLVERGGAVGVVLMLLSVVSLALILIKLTQFWRARVGRHRKARTAIDLWQSGRHADAVALIKGDASAVGRTLAHGMVLASAGQVSEKVLEDEVERVAGESLHGLGKGLRGLDAIVQIAPLIGLFGTVIGMIDAFQAMQSAGASVDPSHLAGGIWIAMLTTALGLGVAMPSSLALTFLETRVDNERAAIESIVGRWMANKQIPPAQPVAQRQISPALTVMANAR